MNKRRFISFLLVFALSAGIFTQGALAVSPQEEQAAVPAEQPGSVQSYYDYCEAHQDRQSADSPIELDLSSISDSSGTQRGEIEGKQAVVTEEDGFVEFVVEIPEDARYQLVVDYYPVEGKGASIKRGILIDGEYPFSEAVSVDFDRIWKNTVDYDDGFEFDNKGDELRPPKAEAPRWMSKAVTASSGLYDKPFLFFLSKGRHTIRLQSEQEPMAVSTLRLTGAEEQISYEQLKKQYDSKGYKAVSGDAPVIIQAENTDTTSQPTVYPIYDRASPLTQPFDEGRLLLNIIGSTSWQECGDTITWKIKVNESGLYKLAFRARNNFVSGRAVSRRLYIDGEIPFQEAESIVIPFDSDWQIIYVSAGEKQCDFYFEAGRTYELKLEVNLGGFTEIIRSVSEATENLNYVYRQILMITGSNPDPNRDYYIEEAFPECMEIMRQEAGRLEACVEAIEAINGGEGAYANSLTVMTICLENMLERPDRIPQKFADFKNSIVTLGSWLLTAQQQPLDLDYIAVVPENAVMLKAEAGFFTKLISNLKMFFISFFKDYNAIGDSSDGMDGITVWTSVGRDQATVIRGLISNSFEKETGISVNFKQVITGSLLPAILSGKGPDVFLTLASTEPVNYAFRGAVQPLDGFEGFEEVRSRFYESAMVPYTFDGKTYGLPETQVIPLMYYRKDIIAELGIELPQTWEDVIDILPVLNNNNMQFGMAVANGSIVSQVDLSMLWSMLFQNGGELYDEQRTKTLLDGETGLEVFRSFTDFYTNYGMDYTFDFANRFRMGEVPIGVSDINMFNSLSVFAPEISGLWDFTLVPGTKKADGTIDRSTASSGTGTVMLRDAKNPELAWRYMEWWCRAEIQSSFAKEMEGILGASARYPVANRESIEQLPWKRDNMLTIKEQLSYAKGIPEIPGSYLLAREMGFAFRDVLIDGKDPTEALLGHTVNINNEITRKRREFNLS